MPVPLSTTSPYELIIKSAVGKEDIVERLCLGITWTTCRTPAGIGFAMSPSTRSRVLKWPGTLARQPTRKLATWLNSWEPFEATVGLSACNAAINTYQNKMMQEAEPISSDVSANLAVFEYFRPHLKGLRTAVIGRYPGIDDVLCGLNFTVLERQPQETDLLDSAAEFILPQSDWVFITATSLINKTFHRLSELSRDSITVLMGPSTPWLTEWSDFGINYVAGVQIINTSKCEQIVSEGGGTCLFNNGVQYAVTKLI
ncbi:MAG: hypothetical protein TECD_00535 [Hyphomicrobiaceae bacterium hypho_1]